MPSSSIDVPASSCYQTYDEFRKRIQTLPSCWDICLHDNYIVFQCKDNVHSVPKFEIFTDPSLSLTVRYLLWCLPDNNEICVKYDHSFKNVTVSNLINDLNSYGVCCGITDKSLGYSFAEHSVPKQFSLTDATCKNTPLHQSKLYRNQHCRILIPGDGNKCHHCRKAETSEKSNTGDLIRYVNSGDSQLHYATLKKSDDIASHVLVFLFRSIVNPLKFTFANFATKIVTSLQLFPLLWKDVGILEDNDLKVMTVTSDGAAANRTMYRLHVEMKHTNNDKGVVIALCAVCMLK